MASLDLLTARIQQRDSTLLLQMKPDLALDPGHWMLPAERQVTATPSPHPNLCGVPSAWAATLQALFQSLQLPLDAIESVEFGASHRSPAWHPVPTQVQCVDIRLDQQAPAPALPKNAARLAWYPGQQWRQAYADGQMLLNPLSRLLLTDAGHDWQNIDHEEPLAGLRMLPVRSNTLPPANHTNAFVIGNAPRLLVDPSPANDAAYADLLARLAPTPPDGILLTHHHPDHHQHAPRLARDLGVPICCSEDTHWRIPSRFGAGYWDGIDTRTLADGEQVTHWLDQPVHVRAVPGHDAGQLALAPANMAWMIVGDLIQGIGTVVIAEPEGDMQAYFGSLQWVIDQDPAVIIPSHGQAMGSSFRIAETLRHRKLREEQVLHLHHAGEDIERMLEMIYQGIDKRLWGLARLNIRSHLRKLEEEGRL